MAGTSGTKSEIRAVSLRTVPAVIPADEEHRLDLATDLTKMGCEGLLAEPWAMKSEALVREFHHPRSNEWEGTLRRLPEQWTADRWAEVYSFRKEGRLKAKRTDTWIEGKFRSPINSKDGHTVEDCRDHRERRVLEFLVPIFYPEKPSRVTKEVGNTIFGALAGEYKVNWGQMIQDVVEHLVSNLEKGKPTPISPYLFHLYYRNECLRGEEMKIVEVARECLEFGVGPDLPPDEEDTGSESVGSEERRKLSPICKRKQTYHSPRGKARAKTPEISALDLDDDPFQRLQGELDRVASKYTAMEAIVKQTSQLLGDCKPENIVKELKKLREKDVESLEASNRKLQRKVEDLSVEIVGKEEELRKFRSLKIEAILEIREIVGHPSDILNKARMFQEYLEQSQAPTLQKVITILLGYKKKMEEVLVEIRKLVSGSVGESSQTLPPAQKETPFREKLLGDLRTPPSQRPGKESSGGASEGAAMTELSTPAPDVPAPPLEEVPTPVLAAASTPAMTEDAAPTQEKVPTPTPAVLEVPIPTPTGSEVPRMTPPEVPVPKPLLTPEGVRGPTMRSPSPSPRKLSLRKQAIPIPLVQELDDSEEDTADTGDTEEDDEDSSPRRGRELRSSGKKSKPVYNSSVVLKRPTKHPGKGEPSLKKPRAK